ncbi:response regulator transcription factor [uncultured Bacteroides sp.]|uniref:response regulator transcription factor n=1 Tax=uncultured Bacteroides sp. TaxID=162156 RepID=UPI00280A9612|nr:response regulator transcription factor [uncultured Bacteroides sp.]
MNLNVAIIDDHPLVLEGLKSLLSHTIGIESIHTAQTGNQLKELMAQHSFQLYIIDLDLPDIDGFILIHQIKQKEPDAKIIVSTMHEEIWIVNKLKSPDIDAVVFKSSAGNYIKKAIQAILKGKNYYCPQFQKLYKEKEKVSNTTDMVDSAPTIRELDVLKAIAKGMSTHEISECLFISENTVEWHRKNLMVKFGAKNATDLVIKALSKGYLSIPLQ